MAITSTSTGINIIKRAFRIIGVLAEGQTLTAQQERDGRQALNALMSRLMNYGLQLWKQKEAILFVNAQQNKYKLGGTNSRCVNTENLYETTNTLVTLAPTTTLELNDYTGVQVGSYLGVVLSNSIFWTTVSALNYPVAPAAWVTATAYVINDRVTFGTNEYICLVNHTSGIFGDDLTAGDWALDNPNPISVTIADSLTDNLLGTEVVYHWVDNIYKPMTILECRRHTLSSGFDLPMWRLSRTQYMALTYKNNNALAVSYFFDRQLTEDNLFIWLTPDNNNEIAIKFSYTEPFAMFENNNDSGDFPPEYEDAIVYQLAWGLCDEYGVSDNRTANIQSKAEIFLQEALSFDKEPVSVQITPNLDPTGYSGGYSGN